MDELTPAQLAAVDVLVAAVGMGRGGALLTSEEGCGASTVLAAVVTRLRGAGRPVSLVTTDAAATSIPGGALAGTAVPSTEVAPSYDGPTEVTLAATAHMEDLAAPAGAVVVIDDAQWLDETSAALVGATCAAGRCLFVVGTRAGSRLPRSLAPLFRDPRVARATLGPVAADDLDPLLDAILGAPATSAAAAHLHAAGEGRPGMIADAARRAVATGSLRRSQGVWDVAPQPGVGGGAGAAAPLGLLGDAGPEARHALDLVAAAPAPPLVVLEAIVGLEVLDDLERGGVFAIVDRAGTERLVFRRPSLGAAVARHLDAPRRRALVAALVEAAERGDLDSAVDEIDLVGWRRAAELPVEPGRALAAARLALDRGDAATAESLARSAQVASGTEVAASVVRALAQWRLGRVAEALRTLDAAAAVAEQGERVDVLRHQLLVRVHATDDAGEGVAAAEASLVTFDPEAAAELAPTLAYLTLLAGWPGRAGAAADRWLEGAAVDDPRHEQARTVQAFAAVQQGRVPTPSAPVLPPSDDSVLTWRRGVEIAGAMGRLHRGEIAQAAEDADRLRREARADGDRLFVGWGAVVGGLARLHTGTLGQAQDDWVEAWRTFVPLGLDSRLRAVRAGLRVVEALGRPRVRDLAALGWFDAVSDGPGLLLAGEQIHLDLLLAVHQEGAGAEDDLRRAVADLDRRGLAVAAAAVRHLLSLVAADRGVVDGLATAAGRLAGERAAAWTDDARARLVGDGPGHLAAVDHLLGLGDALSAHLSLSAVRAAHGADRGIDDRLHALARTTDLPLPPALAGGAASLTAREREVADLAAAGAPSREVAARLGVSPRTVDATLAKVYRKLGIAGRSELGLVLKPGRRPGGGPSA